MEKVTTYPLIPAEISALPDWQQELPDAHLQAWFNENHPAKEMIYKEEYSNQCIFVRDNFGTLFHKQLEALEVISTHTSKSIKLPVYRAKIKNVEFIIRHNFYDWKISVNSDVSLKFPFELFSKPEEQINKYDCEGFEKEWIYQPYSKNNKKFTVQVHSTNLMYTFLFLTKIQLENSKFFN